MRLLSALIGIVLTFSLVMFPISGTRSAAISHDHHPAAAHDGHAHSSAATHAEDDVAVATHDCADHATKHGADGSCCGMGACHAFTATPLVLFAYSGSLMGSITDRRDEQVRGELFARIDRPPRTI